MRTATLFCLLLCVFQQAASSGHILVYSPAISKSHLIMNGRIADTLAEAGHEVVMLILDYASSTSNFTGTSKAKVIRMKNLSEPFDQFLAEKSDQLLNSDFSSIRTRIEFEEVFIKTCRLILERIEELEVIRSLQFDVAFTEQYDTCGAGILRIEGIPQPPSYVPTIEENDNSDVMSFWQRAYNVWMYALATYIHELAVSSTTEVFREYLGESFPNTGDIFANASLCFVNTDEQFDFPRPIISKNIFIGGLGGKAVKPLEKNFQTMMTRGKRGVVIMSFGTIAPFNWLTMETQKAVVNTFARLYEFHFILKTSNDDKTTAELVRDVRNVDIVNWLPQVDLLAHPRIRLFIMHGGLNGLIEAAQQGVPVIVVPFFVDQFRNGRLAEKRGMGKMILRNELDQKRLEADLTEVLENPSYTKKAKRLSKLLKTRPFTPEERLVKWTEFAMSNGVLEHLHVEGSRMNSIIYFNLDVLTAFLLSIAIVNYAIKRACSLLCSRASKLKTKLKAA